MVVSSTGDCCIFEKIKELKLSGEKIKRTLEIEAKVRLKNRVALKFKGIDSPEKASQLVGCELQIEAEDLPALPAGQFYGHKLIGLKVIDKNGEVVGETVDILENPANDLFVIESPQKEEILIPAVKAVVKRIDLKKGLMEIEVVPGLLE